MKISTGETLQNKFAAESKLWTKSQAQKRKKRFSRYRTWVVRRRVTRNNQKLPKQPRELGRSQDYIWHSPRRGRVEGLYQTPEWDQEEIMGSPHTMVKIPNCHQRKHGERETLADPKESKQDRPHCWCPGTRLKHNQDRNNQEEMIYAKILPQISKFITSPY